MTGKPRNERPEEPVWCVKTSHDDSMIGRHVSAIVRAGTAFRYDQTGRGEVAAYLEKTGRGPTLVAVTASHMTTATADISLDEAATLRDGLTSLLVQAGYEDGMTL